MKKEESHITIRNEKLFCFNCGGEHALVYPIGVHELTDKIDGFKLLHKNCPPTWKEEMPVQSESVYKKAMAWWKNGERGSSSETMWHCFMNDNMSRADHPYDPDDFSRCYKLLQYVPEWKLKLQKLKSLSPEWSNLVDNWDKLTEMYGENVRTNWKNSKKIGMYEFMKTLIY
jgi:hypothetical protein